MDHLEVGSNLGHEEGCGIHAVGRQRLAQVSQQLVGILAHAHAGVPERVLGSAIHVAIVLLERADSHPA